MNRKRTAEEPAVPLAMGAAAAALIAVTILAAFSVGSYVIPGSAGPMRAEAWPQPIGWVVHALVVDSWPTYRGVEIRWPIWAIGHLVLLGMALAVRSRWPGRARNPSLWRIILATSILLTALVLTLALASAAPAVGLSWAWQLALGLSWMALLYFWADRLPIEVLAKAIALSLAALAAISLLYAVQGQQRFPGWPTGNVLLLTTACIAGVFLSGTWAYARLVLVWRSEARRDWIGAGVLVVLFALLAVALAMAGRRAGLLGLLAGGMFMLLVTFVHSRRAKIGVPALMLVAGLVAALAGWYLFRAGRWETVVLRAELYERATIMLLHDPAALWIGVGPGQAAFGLTTLMRELWAQSPRLFHGEISEHVHSEPLQAIVEIGLPLGLLYLALLAGGLVGYVLACRPDQAHERRLLILGAGAALAGTLAAEATSVGMRHPGVSALVWALAGIGWACAAEEGLFAGAVERLRWLRQALSPLRAGRAASVAAGVVAIALVGLAVGSFASSARLLAGMGDWNNGRPADALPKLLDARMLPGAGQWMIREYLLGCASLRVARQAEEPAAAAAAGEQALAHLAHLGQVSPGYHDTLVWLGQAQGDPASATGLSAELLKFDPYDPRARMALATYEPDPRQRLTHLRLAMRNADLRPELTDLIVRTLVGPSEAQLQIQRLAMAHLATAGPSSDPVGNPLHLVQLGDLWQQYMQMSSEAMAVEAAQQLLAEWQVAAEQALTIADPSEWPDELALETMRLAVVMEAWRGDLARAARLAHRATTLADRLAGDVWRRRLEEVEIETRMHDAWFGWLSRPGTWQQVEAVLRRRLDEAIGGPAESRSATAASQMLIMLNLMAGQESRAAAYVMVAEGGGVSSLMIRQAMGLAYARLVSLMGQPFGASQAQRWAARGQQLLGETGWRQALERTAELGLLWWEGVLPAVQAGPHPAL